jgi:hypothetical protein
MLNVDGLPASPSRADTAATELEHSTPASPFAAVEIGDDPYDDVPRIIYTDGDAEASQQDLPDAELGKLSKAELAAHALALGDDDASEEAEDYGADPLAIPA